MALRNSLIQPISQYDTEVNLTLASVMNDRPRRPKQSFRPRVRTSSRRLGLIRRKQRGFEAARASKAGQA
jgi:hypothetical protein